MNGYDKHMERRVRASLPKHVLTANEVIKAGFDHKPTDTADKGIERMFGSAWFYIWKATGLLPFMEAKITQHEYRLARSDVWESIKSIFKS